MVQKDSVFSTSDRANSDVIDEDAEDVACGGKDSDGTIDDDRNDVGSLHTSDGSIDDGNDGSYFMRSVLITKSPYIVASS